MELEDFSQTFYNEADTTVTIKQIAKGLKTNLKRKFPNKDNDWLNEKTEKILEMNGIDFNHFNFNYFNKLCKTLIYLGWHKKSDTLIC